jgi:hypothetical protein
MAAARIPPSTGRDLEAIAGLFFRGLFAEVRTREVGEKDVDVLEP